MKKNEIIRLNIEDITSEGNGVGRHEGMAVFVPNTAVGDVLDVKIVKVLKRYCFGIIDRIIEPTKDRTASDCPFFPKCGGCSFRHISYESELRHKEKIVFDAFTRLGRIDAQFLPVLGCDESERYRNKTQYPVGISAQGENICGFYAKRSHRIIGGTDCRLLPDAFGQIAETVLEYTKSAKVPAYDEKNNSGLLRHIFIRQGYHTKEIMVCLVVTENRKGIFDGLCSELHKKFADIKSIAVNINPDNTNVILGSRTEVIFGSGSITDIMCGNSISISPQAFYQVNTAQAERLYRQAEEFAELSGSELLLDLYCGAGTIGLSMAGRVKQLIGAEIVPQAVRNAIQNAERNGIDNAEFFSGDAGETAQRLLERGLHPDVIILDPPRKGSDERTLSAIAGMSPKRIVMISCNPSTAARDCAFLEKNGYKVKKVRAVDMFPRTTAVECVAVLVKN